MTITPRAATAAFLAALALLFCTGCPFPTGTGDGSTTNLDEDGNATLNEATALPLESSDALTFRGAIDGTGDIDVFNLGTLASGDRVALEVVRVSGDLDPVAAIFDSREYLVAFNDDREPDGSNRDPELDFIIQGAEDTYFLGIIAYPGTRTSGEYEVSVTLTRNVGVPTPGGQVVYLNWAGAERVMIPNVGVFSLPPFSAADVGLAAGQTEILKDRVQEIVEDRYAGYNFLVLNSDDHGRPGVPHTTVYFGGSNAQAFAISEKIDAFNHDPADDTIVFSESYASAFRGLDLTVEQMAQALGNTVAHEVGHLLGLVHTADCNCLMDSTCANYRILSAQQFKTSPLDLAVFPFGFQPAEEILGWVLGLVGM